jgi:hypothetical protein
VFEGGGSTEDDGTLVELGHLLDNILSETSANCRKSKKTSGLDPIHDLGQSLQTRRILIGTRERDLVRGELVTTIQRNETFAIDEVKRLCRFFFRQTAVDEVILQHGRDTDAGTTGTEEDEAVFMRFETGSTNRVDETAEDDGGSSLDLQS